MLRDIRTGANKALGKQSWVLQAFLIIVLIIVATKIFKNLKIGAAVVGQSIGNETISKETGIVTNRVIYIRQLATQLWDNGVTNWGLFNYYTDQMFIDTINKMTTPREVELLNQFFQEKSGTSLQQVINESFNSSQKAKVNPNWLAVIQS
jgi:hypothetical protein